MIHPKNPVHAEPYLLQRTLDYHITAWEKDFSQVELDLTEVHMNRNMTPHGGIYALLMDTACAFCGSCPAQGEEYKIPVTLSLNVNYLSTPKGTHLICQGRKTGGGKRNWFAESDVRDETGHLIATATATLTYVIPREPAPAKTPE